MKHKLMISMLLVCIGNAATIDIGFITDPHDDTTTPTPTQPFGDAPGYRIPGVDYSAVSIAAWIATCNDNSVDIAMHGGDIVNGPVSSVAGNDTDRHVNFAQYVARMGTLNADIIHAFGHWDVGADEVTGSDYDDLFDNSKGIGTLQPAGIANPWWPLAATDLNPVAYTFEKNGFRIVVLAGILGSVSGNTDGQYTGPTAATQQEWIDTVALNTALPIIVLAHQPLRLSSGTTAGQGVMGENEAIIASLEGLTIKPVVLQGHVHRNQRFFTNNGITYVNMLGDVWGEEITDTDRFSHSVITITNDNQVYSDVDVQGFGLQSSNSFDASLIANWKLNEPTGTVATDSIIDSVAGADGTPTKAIVSVNGPIDQRAVNFDADLTVTSEDTLLLDFPFTLMGWARFNSTPPSPDQMTMFSIGDLAAINRYIAIGQYFDGTAYTDVRGIKATAFSFSASQVNDGQWHHIAFTASDGEQENRKIYVDGQFEGIGSSDVTGVFPPSVSDWLIGADISTANEKMDGDVDDIRVYSVVLTASQINQIWNAGASKGYRGRYNDVSPGEEYRSRYGSQ